MALSWQLEPASMNPTLSSPHYSPILTSTPFPARRTFTRLTASTPCRTTTPCTPSVTDPGENFPTPNPSSLEAGALHHPSPPPSLLRIRRIPLNLMTILHGWPHPLYFPPYRLALPTPSATTPNNHPGVVLNELYPAHDTERPWTSPRITTALFSQRRLNHFIRTLMTIAILSQRRVHHLIRTLNLPQMTMDRPSRYE
jgi:hypothetical protein